MKEQAYNIIKTKDSRTQRQSNLKKFKEARFKISPQEFEDHTSGEIVSLKYVYDYGSSESAGYLLKETSLRGRLLQKLVSQLELLDEKLSQDDVNKKLLRSLSPELNTHAIVWRNKADLDTMSMNDLYNNLKVYEQG
ncbi:hypothetical protein Tco_1501036 [Tanacetum coccineum]